MITRSTPLSYPVPDSLVLPSVSNKVSPDQILFFDIETTGFAADVTTLYLIGCIYLEQGHWVLTQWFADDNKSESAILTAFFTLAERFSYVLHYNGTGFDLPYLAKKCARYQYAYSIPIEKSYDIYKMLQPLRGILGIANLKQKTIEQYMGISRTDRYSGGELIQYYGLYLKAKYGHLPEEKEYQDMLLLHNAEDLKGLYELLPILSFPAIFTDCQADLAQIDTERNELSIPLELILPLPKSLHIRKDAFTFHANEKQATIRLPLCKQELKFFYSNYKDYYYLPEEDIAIHKSVAFYVDKDYRTKAKAANCYSKHTGCFVPQYEELLSPFFKIDYSDKITWLEVTPDFCNDTAALTIYARHLLRQMY